MKRMFFLMLALIVLSAASVNAQVKIGGDGTTGPVAGAVLELDGAQGALLLPRVDTLAITSPTAGMQVYREADKKVYTYDGTSWKASTEIENLNAIPGTVKKITRYDSSVTVDKWYRYADVPVSPYTAGKTLIHVDFIGTEDPMLGRGATLYGISNDTVRIWFEKGINVETTCYYIFSIVEFN